MSINDTYKKIEEAVRPHLYKYEEPWLNRKPMIEDIIEVLYPGHTEVGEYGTVADRRDWRDDEIAKLRREYDKKQFPVDHGVDIIGDEYE